MSTAVPLVVITRPAEAGPSLARALARHGVRTWHVAPTVVTAPVACCTVAVQVEALEPLAADLARHFATSSGGS